MTKEELEKLGTLFEQTPDDIAYIRNRFPESCPSPQSIEEHDLYQARLKVLMGMQPKTVALLEQANATNDSHERQRLEKEAVAAYFAELARYWNEDQLRGW
jgi:hypothetical protein